MAGQNRPLSGCGLRKTESKMWPCQDNCWTNFPITGDLNNKGKNNKRNMNSFGKYFDFSGEYIFVKIRLNIKAFRIFMTQHIQVI